MSDDILQLEGADELNKVLDQLITTNTKIGNKVTHSTLRAGASETARRQRRKAPPGNLRKAIGSKVRKKRGSNE